MSAGVTLFNSFDLIFQLVLGVLHGLTDLVSGLVGLFGSGFPVRFMYLPRGVFSIPPDLLYCTFTDARSRVLGCELSF